MFGNILMGMLLALAATSCSKSPRIQIHSLPKPKPTSYLFPIEEYTILRYFGNYLGMAGLPELVLLKD